MNLKTKNYESKNNNIFYVLCTYTRNILTVNVIKLSRDRVKDHQIILINVDKS